MMYRDGGPLPCPRCGDPLAAFDEGRAKWRCKQCGGTLVGPEELGVEIGEHEIGPKLDIIADAPCPLCYEPMQPIDMRGHAVARCEKHRHVWFDRGVLGRVRTSAT